MFFYPAIKIKKRFSVVEQEFVCCLFRFVLMNSFINFYFIVILFLHLLRNLGVVLLEALAHALLRGHPLEDAAVEAARLLGGERFGGEVVDAGGEAVLDKTAESLDSYCCQLRNPYRFRDVFEGERDRTYADELFDLTLLHALLESALFGIC